MDNNLSNYIQDSLFWSEKRDDRQKCDEVAVVIRFLKNENVTFSTNITNFQLGYPEPVDVYVRDINKKFQVTYGDHELLEEVGKLKLRDGTESVTLERRALDIEREYIVRPLECKRRLDPAANNIVLLINSYIRSSSPPDFLKSCLTNFNPQILSCGKNRMLNLGWEKIYWVCKDGNLTRDIFLINNRE